MRPILFHIGDIAVSSFWTTAFAGFVVAFFVVRRDCVRRGYGVDLAYDMLLYATSEAGWRPFVPASDRVGHLRRQSDRVPPVR